MAARLTLEIMHRCRSFRVQERAMLSTAHVHVVEPIWRRLARYAICALVGVGAVTFLICVLTFLHPVLP